MKKILPFLLIFLPILSFSQVYDPGDLINAVKRSQVITDMFLERWDVVQNSLKIEDMEDLSFQERFYYFQRGGYSRNVDIYLHGENISGYPVSTPYGTYDLTLFRVYGSVIAKFKNLVPTPLFNWGFAVGAAGYRYGLYREIELEGNSSISDPGSGDFTVKDYMYTQVFDDLLVLTNIFEPYGYIHTGILLNDQIDPGPDGIVDTADDTEINSRSRIFLNSNILNFLFVNLGYNADEDQTEFATTKVEVFSLLEIPQVVKKRALWPDLFVGYTYVNAQYDSEFESVFKQQHTLFLEWLYNYYNAFYIKGKNEFFLSGKLDNEKGYLWKQFYTELGFRIDSFLIVDNPETYYGKGKQQAFLTYYLIFGLSHLIDGRSQNFGNDTSTITGYSFGFKLALGTLAAGGSLEARISRNYSQKLYTLIEAYDHWVYELSIQIGF